MGETGPCGPCSEIHYDLGPEASELGHPNCAFPCECGRYVEIWNLVFMQFDRNPNGHLNPLPKPSIDTGMGLERIATVLQGKISNFETDLLRPIIGEASRILNVEYGASAASDVSLRIVADHVHAATFLISDGIIPSNEGRGYVLRKIMRRGIRQGTLLGYKEPFLYQLSGFVVEMMKEAYPDLVNTRDYVARVIRTEEDRFASMVTVGLQRLEDIIDQLTKSAKDFIPGVEIFKLYDTYGFPLDFTKEIADEKSMRLDMDGFNAELEKQRERARQSWKGDEAAVAPLYGKFVEKGGTQFLGYQAVRSDSRVLGILTNGGPADSIEGKGAMAEVILDQTPFYAESGGQVGDVGTLTSPDGVARVLDTSAPVRGVVVHKVKWNSAKSASAAKSMRRWMKIGGGALPRTTRAPTFCTAFCAKPWGRMSSRLARWSLPTASFRLHAFRPADRSGDRRNRAEDQPGGFPESAGPDPGDGHQSGCRWWRRRILWRKVPAAGSSGFDTGRQHGIVRRHPYEDDRRRRTLQDRRRIERCFRSPPH